MIVPSNRVDAPVEVSKQGHFDCACGLHALATALRMVLSRPDITAIGLLRGPKVNEQSRELAWDRLIGFRKKRGLWFRDIAALAASVGVKAEELGDDTREESGPWLAFVRVTSPESKDLLYNHYVVVEFNVDRQAYRVLDPHPDHPDAYLVDFEDLQCAMRDAATDARLKRPLAVRLRSAVPR